MKVKYEFEEKDFLGRGQLIVHQSAKRGNISPTLVYKVGYGYPSINGTPKPCLISMADGLVNFYHDLSTLVADLNMDPVGYRPLTQEEIVQVENQVDKVFLWRIV